MAVLSRATNANDGMIQANPQAKPATDEPRVGILRRPTVQFEDPPTDENSHQALESPIVPIKCRTGTLETEASKASSKLEARWRRQTVLSFGE